MFYRSCLCERPVFLNVRSRVSPTTDILLFTFLAVGGGAQHSPPCGRPQEIQHKIRVPICNLFTFNEDRVTVRRRVGEGGGVSLRHVAGG